MLVVTAFMFLRTLQNAAAMDPGLRDAQHHAGQRGRRVVRVPRQRPWSSSSGCRRGSRVLGGVESVAAARMIPLQGSSLGLGRIRVQGRVSPTGDDTVRRRLERRLARVLRHASDAASSRARTFTAADRDGGTMVAVVNETFARTAWPDRLPSASASCRAAAFGGEEERPVEIVGVVADAKYRYISEEPMSFVFVPLAQQPMTDTTFFIRHAEGRPIGAGRAHRARAGRAERAGALSRSRSRRRRRLACCRSASPRGSPGAWVRPVSARRARALRLDGVPRGAAHTRDRDPRRAWRLERRHAGDGAEAGRAAWGSTAASSASHWPRGRIADAEPARRRAAGRPRVVRRDDAAVRGGAGGGGWSPARRAATTNPASALRAEYLRGRSCLPDAIRRFTDSTIQ
jgi:hypothetical protein